MKILPLLVFSAAAGIGSSVMSYKQIFHLNYENAKLALQVNYLERRIAALHKSWRNYEDQADTRNTERERAPHRREARR